MSPSLRVGGFSFFEAMKKIFITINSWDTVEDQSEQKID